MPVTAPDLAAVISALYGWDGAAQSRMLVESAANPNARTALYSGATGPATVDAGGRLSSIGPASSFTQNNAIAASVNSLAALAGLRLMGFAARESAAGAAAATFILRHGTLDTDPVIAPVELSANESTREWWFPGIPVASGVRIQVVAGTVDVTLFHATIT